MAAPLPTTIGALTLGPGRPAICVPLVGRSLDDLVTVAGEVSRQDADLVELRIDFVDDAFGGSSDPDGPSRVGADRAVDADLPMIEDAVRRVRAALPADLPLLFTLRSQPEGGERDVTPTTYDAVLRRAIGSGAVDAVDVEMYTDPDLLDGLVEAAHDAGLTVVMSSHDFTATPGRGEIVSRLLEQQEHGADVVKFAAMPHSIDDVLTVLGATADFRAGAGFVPAITMSMGPLGVVSRLAGETFGSCVTFGSVGESSAPGQVPAGPLAAALDAVHEAQGD